VRTESFGVWPTKRLKYSVSLRSSRFTGAGDPRPFLGLEHIESFTGRYLSVPMTDSSDAEATAQSLTSVFHVGDVLFGKLRPYLAKAWVAEFAGLCSTEFLVMRPEDYDARFLRYILLSRDFIDAVDASTFGSKMPRADWNFIGNMALPVPAVEVQLRVADYLDRETAQLDAVIASKKRMLRLVAEKRRALITRAVTRGIDPSAPLRESGIPWLGAIPAHWGVTKTAWLFRHRDERGEPQLPLLEVSINSGVTLREFSSERIESTAADFNTYKISRRGDIVFNKMRMWHGAVGVAPEDGLVSPDYVVAAPTGAMSPAFAGLLFRTEMFSAECARHSHGIVWDRLRLYWEGFRDIRVPLPPPTEQEQVVAKVDRECAKLDRVRLVTERSILLLKERRAALIAAAVTGQLPILESAELTSSEEEMACSSTT